MSDPAPTDGARVGRELWPADVVYLGAGAPIAAGAVAVQRRTDGTRTVIAADTLARLATRFPDAVTVAARPVLAPPAVNAHTHLDLSDMPFTPGTYHDFVRAVIDFGRSGGRGAVAARRGLAELEAAGTTIVGDVVHGEETMRLLLDRRGLDGVAYWEVLEPDPARADEALEAASVAIQRFMAWQRPGGVRVGLAPHTPHTVSAPLLRGLATLARRLSLPMQIHVAEVASEVELHRHGGGALRAALGPLLGAWRASGLSPIGYLRDLGVLDARPTLVHMVHVDDEDVGTVARSGCPVVHCPRSNHALACGAFPWTLYARHGVTVALGTDSRGSSPDLDVRAEIDAARHLHGAAANPAQLIWSSVKGGARALARPSPLVRRGESLDALLGWPAAVHRTTDRGDADGLA